MLPELLPECGIRILGLRCRRRVVLDEPSEERCDVDFVRQHLLATGLELRAEGGVWCLVV